MNNRNFAVGVFVVLGLAAIVSATLWLTGRQGTEPTVHYSMFFETGVDGLMLGGPVFYLGVDVGTVTAMEIVPMEIASTETEPVEIVPMETASTETGPVEKVPAKPIRVRVDAEILKSAPINTGTFASLALQGITGVAVIKLSADPDKNKALPEAKDGSYQVISVRDAGISALLAKFPDVVDRVDSVLIMLEYILGEENRTFVSDMLADISTITAALAAKEETIGELPDLLKQSIEELQSTLEQVKAMTGRLEPGLSSTLSNLEDTTANLAKMTERMEHWTANSDSEMNAFMGDGLGQVPELIADARATMREIDKLVKDLRENPSAIVYKPVEKAVEVEQ